MQVIQTLVADTHLIDVESRLDDRGSFGRTWCAEVARAHGLCPYFEQSSVSFNRARGTLRGLHFQRHPHSEVKLVRCTAGAIFDVVLDLRPESLTFRRWTAFRLDCENRRALYIPRGCAHGFLTLTDGAEVLYQISPAYKPGFESGVRWDDPAFGIEWPEAPRIMSERDKSWPDFEP